MVVLDFQISLGAADVAASKAIDLLLLWSALAAAVGLTDILFKELDEVSEKLDF
jgi:hypothetical protein